MYGMLNKYMELNNMKNEEPIKLLNRIESISKTVSQVIKMLDKNVEESCEHGTDAETALLMNIQTNLIERQGFSKAYAQVAIQYLTGRLTVEDFTGQAAKGVK
tara:strand:- start:245 stop:553 length:309 start_codon:yes stop_codon:yes gene_type:complete